MKYTRISIFILFILAGLLATAFFVSQAAAGTNQGALWSTRCDGEGKTEYCEIFQRLTMADTGLRVLEFALGFPERKNEGRGVVILPLGILLPAGVNLQVDDNAPFTFDVRYCTGEGCYAFIDINAGLLKTLRKGTEVTLFFKAQNGQLTKIPLSLKGFTKAYKSII